MTYPQIFKEIYYNNKKFILTYITICLIFSVLAFGNGNTAFATATYTTTDVVTTLGGNFGVIVAPIAQTYLGSIDTPSAMLLLGAVSFALDVLPEDVLSSAGNVLGIEGLEGLRNYSFGILDLNFFRIFFLLWFIISKLARSNHVTYTVGTILEDLEVKFGVVLNFLVVGTQILANIPLDSSVQAASAASEPTHIIGFGFNALLSFLLLVVTTLIYIFIRCFFFFIDIILMPVCSVIPFTSTSLETVKSFGITILALVGILNPAMFFVIFILTLILSIVLFKKAYISICYFKNIYTKPFFKKLSGYNSEIPLVSPKIPKKVMYFVDGNADIIIPVYLLKKVPAHQYTRRHDRWWFVSEGNRHFICKPCFSKKTCYSIELTNTMQQKMFIKKSLRFFEIFNVRGSEESIGRTLRNVPKNIHFVFSKEYYYRFDQMKQLTGFIDYTNYRNHIRQGIKLSRKEIREQNRMERLEAKEEKRLAKQR